MQALFNCHSVGLHSFPIETTDNGLLRRIYFADKNHNMWRPEEIAIHPHHSSIRLTVLAGRLKNVLFSFDETGSATRFQYNEWRYTSAITDGRENGSFLKSGSATLWRLPADYMAPGMSVVLEAEDLHTIWVAQDEMCVWLIEELEPDPQYDGLVYSNKNLEEWSSDDLYLTRSRFIGDEDVYRRVLRLMATEMVRNSHQHTSLQISDLMPGGGRHAE